MQYRGCFSRYTRAGRLRSPATDQGDMMPRSTYIRKSQNNPLALSLSDLEFEADGWYSAGVRQMRSPGTIANRRFVIGRLVWFMERGGHTLCDVETLRDFFTYLATGHLQPEGRWGDASARMPPRPAYVKLFHAYLASFFAHCVREERLQESPMRRVEPPAVPPAPIQPFDADQAMRLLQAASRTRTHIRDEALISFLLDTGCRASEVCGLLTRDLDLTGKQALVTGKGNKRRLVWFGDDTKNRLFRLLRAQGREAEAPVFRGEGGHTPGEAMTRSGILRLVKRLGKAAGLEGVRCSPHTARHSFAVNFLNGGGSLRSLQMMLGHSRITTTEKYLFLTEADLAKQHALASPVDRLRRGKR